MKSNPLLLFAAIVTTLCVPSGSYAAQKPPRMDVTVMLRGEIEPEKLKKGSYAHVEYESGGVEGVMWGLIEQIEPDGILIESTAIPSTTQKTALGDIDLLAVSVDRTSLERWREARKAAAEVTVMPRGHFDSSKLEAGGYAHVVFTSRGLNRRTSGTVVAIDGDGITIKSDAEPPETWTITPADIDTVAFSSTSQALDRWRRWTQSGILSMSRWDLNPSMLEEGLYVHVVYTSRGRKRKAVGRIVDSYGDSVVIQYRVGGKATWAHPENLEVAYSDVETVTVARDRQDLQALGRARSYFGYSREHNVEGRPRVALKLIFGTVFGALSAAPVALGHFPDHYRDDPDAGEFDFVPLAILHAAATAWVVCKVDPPARYGPVFAGSVLGCAAVSSAILLSDLDGYQGPAVAWLGYISATTLAATIASEISRETPDAPGFTVGVAPRRNGSVSALATYRF